MGFGSRQLSDVACKALSPAVNDPYTAVQAIDHLTVIFCEIAARPLGDTVARDGTGRGAVIVPGRTFEELLAITCGLIRRFSGREPTVLVALLRMLGTCAEFARGDDVRRLRAIDEQAALVLSQGEAEIAQPLDLAQVQAAANRLRQRIPNRLATLLA